jgi:Transposase DDE domain group 1
VACEGHNDPGQKGIRWMRLSHARRAVSARFDDPNLVSCAGLVPVMALAQRCGLVTLLIDRLKITATGGANPAAKIFALVAGMVCGADSIDDMNLLRHGGMSRLFDGVRAPSTLGTFLRLFTFGHVRQLDAVAARLLTRLAAATPVLPDADQQVFIDIDDTVRQTYGYAKQGAGRGYTGVKGLNALLAVISTRLSMPLIAATRLRKGSTNSARGAGKLLADALATARRAGATGWVLVRADSAYYSHDIVATCRRAGARFSVTARLTPSVATAITSIDEQAWTPIQYPNAIYDEVEQRWVSDAEVAEIGFTAFTGRRKAEHVTARLIVRRVRRLNPTTAPAGKAGKQGELFAVYRYHAVFTDSTEPMLAAEATHRDHAIIEQVIAELKNGPLTHLPSGVFTANAAWLTCAAVAHNLTRAAGALADGRHARTRTATLRTQLINTPARVAHSAHRQVLHLPRDWPYEPGLDELFRRALHDPLPTAA